MASPSPNAYQNPPVNYLSEKQKFPSIATASSDLPLLETTGVIDDKTWIITEKADGANLSFHLNNGEIRYACRTCFIDVPSAGISDTPAASVAGESRGVKYFYQHLHLDANIRGLFNILTQREPDLCKQSSELIVYGEYIGPNSPGGDVYISEDGKHEVARNSDDLLSQKKQKSAVKASEKPETRTKHQADKQQERVDANVKRYSIPYKEDDFFAFKVCVDEKPLHFDKMTCYLQEAGIKPVIELKRTQSLLEAITFDTYTLKTRHEVHDDDEHCPEILYNSKMNDDSVVSVTDRNGSKFCKLAVQAEGIVIRASDFSSVNLGKNRYELVYKKKTDLHKENGDNILLKPKTTDKKYFEHIADIHRRISLANALTLAKADSKLMKQLTEGKYGVFRTAVIRVAISEHVTELSKYFGEADVTPVSPNPDVSAVSPGVKSPQFTKATFEEIEHKQNLFIKYCVKQAEAVLNDKVLKKMVNDMKQNKGDDTEK